MAEIKYGVPQGSVLGPILFLLFVNDMYRDHGIVHLFADDTNILYSNKDIKQCVKNVNKDMIKLSDWFNANKLTVNTKKSNFMIIKSARNHIPCKDVKIMFNGSTLERVDECKYLGVYIDSNLNWKCHINYLVKAVGPIVGVLYRVNKVLPTWVLKIIYFSLIHSKITYCISAWGAAKPSIVHPLVVIQKKAIRAICKVRYNDHTEPLFKTLRIQPLLNVFFINICIHVCKCLNSHSNSLLELNHTMSNIHTRQSYMIPIPHHKTDYFCQSFSHNGPKFYNILPEHVKRTLTIPSFKNSLLVWLNFKNIENIHNIIFPSRFNF